MKLLFDENLSFRLVSLLASDFPSSTHVGDVGLTSATDNAIWEYARDNGFVIVSKDTDFEQRALLLGHPPKVVWLRLGNCATEKIVDVLRHRKPNLLAFEADAQAAFIAIS